MPRSSAPSHTKRRRWSGSSRAVGRSRPSRAGRGPAQSDACARTGEPNHHTSIVGHTTRPVQRSTAPCWDVAVPRPGVGLDRRRGPAGTATPAGTPQRQRPPATAVRSSLPDSCATMVARAASSHRPGAGLRRPPTNSPLIDPSGPPVSSVRPATRARNPPHSPATARRRPTLTLRPPSSPPPWTPAGRVVPASARARAETGGTMAVVEYQRPSWPELVFRDARGQVMPYGRLAWRLPGRGLLQPGSPEASEPGLGDARPQPLSRGPLRPNLSAHRDTCTITR